MSTEVKKPTEIANQIVATTETRSMVDGSDKDSGTNDIVEISTIEPGSAVTDEDLAVESTIRALINNIVERDISAKNTVEKLETGIKNQEANLDVQDSPKDEVCGLRPEDGNMVVLDARLENCAKNSPENGADDVKVEDQNIDNREPYEDGGNGISAELDKIENLDSYEPSEYIACQNKPEDADTDLMESAEIHVDTDDNCSLSVKNHAKPNWSHDNDNVLFTIDGTEDSNSENDMKDQDMPQSTGSETASDNNMCSICHQNAWKYKCPRCLVKTCSLKCVKEHKKQQDCDGVRCKTSFIPLSCYNESHMLSDYRLLEEIARSCDNHERETKNSTPMMTKWMAIQVKEARKIKINLKLSPYAFSQRRINSTFFNARSREFFWHIEWHFPKHNLSLHQKKNKGSKSLSEIFRMLLDTNITDHLCLENYSSDNEVLVFMKRVDLPANQEKYHKIDLKCTLKEVLHRKTIVEYPKLIVVSAQDADNYEKSIFEENIPFPPLKVGAENTQKRKFHRPRFNSKRGRYRNFRGRGRRNPSSAGHRVPRPPSSDYSSAESFP